MRKPSRTIGRIAVAAAVAWITVAPAHAATIDVTVVNASSRAVTGLYLAATAQTGWGPDQLNGDFLDTNGSLRVAGVTCGQPSLVVVAEDVNGCFLYQSVSCGSAATWTITNATTRDCGR